MSRRTPRPSGSTVRLVDRLATRPDPLAAMLRARYGFTRRDLWRDAPAPRPRPAAAEEVGA